MKRRRPQTIKILAIMLVLSIFPLFASGAMAAYPDKPVRLIVPYPPGGTTDVIGRLIAEGLSKRLGERVFVDNKGGGGGIIGTEIASKADPDGYTLYVGSGSFTIQPALQKLPYDPRTSFVPIARAVSGSVVLIVRSTLPVHSVKELIAMAKEKPGQLIFVSSGVGGTPHLAIELFKEEAGIDFKIVHFKGGGPAMVDLMGGHSDAAINSIPQALPGIKSGKFRVLGSSGEKRSAFLPDVPTIAEAGVPGYEVTQWFGLFAPAGTPQPIVDKLNSELKDFLAQDEVQKRFLKSGAEVGYLGSAQFAQFLDRELKKWAKVVKDAGIKLR